jgi:hypothetical protein
MPQWMTMMSYNGMEAIKRLGLAKLHISIIWRAPSKINKVKSAARKCDNNKSTWKPQELLHDDQYNQQDIIRELLIDEQYNNISWHGSRNCSMMSSIIQELLIVSSNTKRRHGSRNCSMMSSIIQELLIVSSNTKRQSRHDAARLQSSCTGVHSRTRQRSAMALTMTYADHRSDGD